jgi:hypothetical protein
VTFHAFLDFIVSNVNLHTISFLFTIGSQLPSFNESSYIDSSCDDSSVFERDDSLTENGTLSGDTRHQFSGQKRSNANEIVC